MSFPPRPTQVDDIQRMLEVFAAVVEGRTAIYVSSPLTTGQLYSDWYRARDKAGVSDAQTGEDLQRFVLDPNRDRAREFVRSLRSSAKRVVIDPLGLADIPGWSQDDYRFFWGRVLQRYADTAIFRDGWHYSSGCAFEFLTACQSQIKTLKEDMTSLSPDEGRRLIRAAIEDNRLRGITTGFLEGVLAALNAEAEKQVIS